MTIKVSLVSDLHLDISGYQELPGGEVLILAGDVAESRSIHKHFHSTKLVQDTPDEHYRCSEFFYHECAKYDQVFYVMGNHEHYHGKFHKTKEELISVLPKNVTLLENESVEYKGVLFLGATLWTDCNKGDPLTLHALKYSMNDYRVITNHYVNKNIYAKLTPEHTASVHRDTLNYFKTTLDLNRDKPVVVITHHGPSPMSINERYKNDYLMNGGFMSDLSALILDHPNIKYFFHGHMHDPVDYMIGSTRVMSNPRGYVGYEDTSKFDPNFTVDI